MPKEKEFSLEIDENINEIVDEVPGNSFIALRKLRWNQSSPFRIDIRKWYTNNEGKEIAGKGVSFATEEGPNNLVHALLSNGYGDTRKTLESIKDREDFAVAVKEIIEYENIDLDSIEIPKIESLEEEFYDPKSII